MFVLWVNLKFCQIKLYEAKQKWDTNQRDEGLLKLWSFFSTFPYTLWANEFEKCEVAGKNVSGAGKEGTNNLKNVADTRMKTSNAAGSAAVGLFQPKFFNFLTQNSSF